MSKIEWTDETWNPVTGCTRVSPGCDHCYMYRLYPRLKAMGVPGYDKSPGEVTLMRERLVQPYRWRKPRRVFVNSMSDLFHSDVPTSFIDNIFVVMEQNPQHQFQILTKRPKSAVHWWRRQTHCREWPPNVWMGTSVESEEYMDRIKQIMKLPAKVRFVSAEPLLGPLPGLGGLLSTGLIHWVIIGGESGPGARGMGVGWAKEIRDACHEARVPLFLKQLGGVRDKRGGVEARLDGRAHLEFPALVQGRQR